MQGYVWVKGHYGHIHRWREDLLAQFLPTYKNGKPFFRGITEDGKAIKELRRLSIRPIELFEIGFAKEELDNVANMIGTSDYILERYPLLRMGSIALRKTMGLKEWPSPTNLDPQFQPNPMDKSVAVVPIGIKEDQVFEGREQI